MNQAVAIADFGELIEPNTLKIQRRLPGSIDRVWAYLTESDLRRQWLAAGTMEMKQGAPFALTWRNDKLMDDPGQAPEGFGGEHSMESEITELDPPHRLGFSWGGTGGVTIELEQQGDEVLLTLIHRRLPDRSYLLNVSAGWHAHLDVLAARMAGSEPARFWDQWVSLKQDYDQRLPA
jgi:uncharacterized protein YndB with AHSA1/START domain